VGADRPDVSSPHLFFQPSSAHLSIFVIQYFGLRMPHCWLKCAMAAAQQPLYRNLPGWVHATFQIIQHTTTDRECPVFIANDYLSGLRPGPAWRLRKALLTPPVMDPNAPKSIPASTLGHCSAGPNATAHPRQHRGHNQREAPPTVLTSVARCTHLPPTSAPAHRTMLHMTLHQGRPPPAHSCWCRSVDACPHGPGCRCDRRGRRRLARTPGW
jgi:hypothetical protein